MAQNTIDINKKNDNMQAFSDLIKQGGDPAVKAMSVFIDRTGKAMQSMSPGQKKAQRTAANPSVAPRARAQGKTATAAPAFKPSVLKGSTRPIGLADGTGPGGDVGSPAPTQAGPQGAAMGVDDPRKDTQSRMLGPREKVIPESLVNIFGPALDKLIMIATQQRDNPQLDISVGGELDKWADTVMKKDAQKQEITAARQDPTKAAPVDPIGALSGRGVTGQPAQPSGPASPRPAIGGPALPSGTGASRALPPSVKPSLLG